MPLPAKVFRNKFHVIQQRLSPLFHVIMTFLGLLLLPLLLSFLSSQALARKFDVGGRDGWVVKPYENYNHWAQRNRFQVNDTLHFKYIEGSDSVLAVKEEDYNSCNTNSPMEKMDDGDSIFHLNNSGPFFFISGNTQNCQNGQKLFIIVMAVRHHNPPPPTPVAPSSEAPSLPPQQIDPFSFSSPVPSPSNEPSSSTRFGGLSTSVEVGVWVILIFTSFIELV
ncbi:early nodulin-like protein 3 [Arachis stenosperma]|uniref:early nodulin-like protein 3 n=1 Tax=Arachis stenosperma TaxID=217475 RepID=UPI0025AB6A74|nr:early nodulin-like protein 3 [Arachis stenosperma]